MKTLPLLLSFFSALFVISANAAQVQYRCDSGDRLSVADGEYDFTPSAWNLNGETLVNPDLHLLSIGTDKQGHGYGISPEAGQIWTVTEWSAGQKVRTFHCHSWRHLYEGDKEVGQILLRRLQQRDRQSD